MKTVRNPRDHGYGPPPGTEGAPITEGPLEELCPHCGATPCVKVKVYLREAPPLLRRPLPGERIVGHYIGCAACPWASPMIITLEAPTRQQVATGQA